MFWCTRPDRCEHVRGWRQSLAHSNPTVSCAHGELMDNVVIEMNMPPELNNQFLSFAYSRARTLPVWPHRVAFNEKVLLSQT